MKKHYKHLINGAIISVIVSSIANLLTLGHLQPNNVIVSGILGSIAFLIFNMKGGLK